MITLQNRFIWILFSVKWASICRHLHYPNTRRKQEGHLHDIYDASIWLQQVEGDPTHFWDKGGACKSLVFLLCADGVRLFDNSHSVWPLALACLNLPPDMRMKFSALWLSFIIPPCQPNKTEPRSVQSMLEIVHDEFMYGYQEGFWVEDGCWQQRPQLPRYFKCRVKLLVVVGDYPGLCLMGRLRRQPALQHACNFCHQEGVNVGDKTAYPGLLTCSILMSSMEMTY